MLLVKTDGTYIFKNEMDNSSNVSCFGGDLAGFFGFAEGLGTANWANSSGSSEGDASTVESL